MSYRQGKLTSYRGPAAHGAHTYSVDNLAVGMGGHDSASDRASTPTDRPGARPPVALKTFSPVPKDDGRFGRSVLTDVRQRSCMNISHTTPVGTPVTLEDALGGAGQEQKQTSPFYADPADILSTIIRRSPLNRLASSNSSQRHSEPPKQLFGNDDALPSAGHPWGNGNGYNVNVSNVRALFKVNGVVFAYTTFNIFRTTLPPLWTSWRWRRTTQCCRACACMR